MNTATIHEVHALVDQLQPVQLDAVKEILQSMLDPFSGKLALAPFDDEPFTEEDRRAVAEADEWREHNDPIPLADVLADFGLTLADWETMGKSPLIEENGNGSKHG